MVLDPLFLVVIGAAIAAGLTVLALAAMFGGGGKKFGQRLARVSLKATDSTRKVDETVSIRSMQSDSGIRIFDRLIKKYLPRPAVLRSRLVRTGIRISLGEYILFCLVVAIAAGFLATQLLIPSWFVGGLIGLSAGLMLPHAIVNLLIARRLKAFTAEFPQAIDLIVRGLKSGLPVPASIRSVAEEIKDPVGSEFAIISDRLRVGQTLEDALHAAAQRIPTPEFHFFVTSLAVQRETGGNLAETLENLSDVLRQRRQMKLKIKAMSSEAKASAMILGSLPFVMFGIMMLVNAEYVMQLFTDPRGMWLVGFGFVCLGIGIAVMAKMVRFDI